MDATCSRSILRCSRMPAAARASRLTTLQIAEPFWIAHSAPRAPSWWKRLSIRSNRRCRAYKAPVLARGGGTSLAGQCCNVAVVIDTSKYMNRVLEIDADTRLARVQPGTVLDTLQAAARAHNLVFGPDPATHTHCTLGGMIGNNSCGVHSVMSQFYGPGIRTSDNIEEM